MHRRLVRTHIFIWIALSICVLYYFVVASKHMQSVSVGPMQGVISPRYIMSLLSGSFLALFSVGVLVLVFDLLRRDETSRIQEVIWVKPVRNLDFLVGRLLGVMMTMSIPMLSFLAAMVVYGAIADALSLSIGQPIVLSSVMSFVLLDVVPNFAFFGSLAILISALSKSRLVAIFFTAFCLGSLFWLNSRLPLDMALPLHTVTGNVLFASELTPEFFTPTIVLNRFFLVLCSVAFLYWTSSLEYRLNPVRFRELALGCTSFVLGVLVFGTMVGTHVLKLGEIDRWVNAHDDHFIPNTFPDVQDIRGQVDIRPGQSVEINLTLDVRTGPISDRSFVVFSLNPGYTVSTLTVGGEKVDNPNFKNGLLKIPSKYFSSDTNELKILAKGYPDDRFAYLDSIDTVAAVSGPEIRQLRLLGTENYIFHNKFVVLSPGIKWYPTSGTATNEDSWEQRERDFFTLNIDVSVPENWLVAGPAKRVKAEDNSRNTYQFQQSDPIPEFALVASNFESASLEVEGIEFEVLYSHVHKRTFDAFAPAEDNIRERLGWTIEAIRAQGLNYSNRSYTLVEVPTSLRVFGGGVRMDTVMCPPGMLMIKESTLPTYPNAAQFSSVPSNQSEMTEENWIASQLDQMIRYVQSSMFESSLNYVLYRNLLVQHTNATQQGAQALNILLGIFAEVLFPARHADFDFHFALNRDILDLVSLDPIHFLGSRQRWAVFSPDLERLTKSQAILNAPEVWDAVASLSIHDARTEAGNIIELRALKLRSKQFVQLLWDSLDTDALAAISADLTNSFRGKNFLFEDFVDVLSEHGVELEELAGDLVHKAELPGFIVSNPNIQAQSDSDPLRYEISLLLHNNQPISGPVQLSIAYKSDDPFQTMWNPVSLPPILVSADQHVRVVIESPNPVQSVWVKPYLSLNRTRFRIDVPVSENMHSQEVSYEDTPSIKAIEIVAAEQLTNSSVIVDDLDPKFSVIEDSDQSVLSSSFTQFFRGILGTENVQLDGGLPVYKFNVRDTPSGWSRKTDPSAFGIYRRTFVLTTNNNEHTASAKFSTQLPREGKWKLEYYLPDQFLLNEIVLGGMRSVSMMISLNFSTINLEIDDGATSVSQSIEPSNLTTGWHTVGIFDLSNKDVDVLVSNKTNHRHQSVIADAIRWTPIE